MAIVDDFSPVQDMTSAVQAPRPVRSRLDLARAGGSALARALAAGWRAAAEYRQMSAMSDRQLGLRGLARSDIPAEIHQRHFASLGG